ncbi:MAG: polysaccharide biosynthesis C-terminal domain-containing protein, partial [Deltaproteobacteria bacterium]|nr:polysaccharide biosynthesis C-terminal domain-containing protein [Deltaproteobacteria bacterium]
KTPVKMAVVSLFANVGLSLILMGPMNHAGLALANSLASILYVSLLLVWLRKKIGEIDRSRIMRSLLQIAVASAATGWVAYWVVGRTSWMNPGNWGEKILFLGAAIVAGMFTYIVISYLLRNAELSFLIGLLRGKRKQLRHEGEIE